MEYSDLSAASAKQGTIVSENIERIQQKTENDGLLSERGFDISDSQTTFNADVEPLIHEQEGSVKSGRIKSGSNQERGD